MAFRKLGTVLADITSSPEKLVAAANEPPRIEAARSMPGGHESEPPAGLPQLNAQRVRKPRAEVNEVAGKGGDLHRPVDEAVKEPTRQKPRVLRLVSSRDRCAVQPPGRVPRPAAHLSLVLALAHQHSPISLHSP